MNKSADTFLKILFNEGEEVYASPDKYSSVWDRDNNRWKIYRPSVLVEKVDKENSVLVGLNPISGPVRSDENVKKYRSFLIELDGMGLKEQMSYIKQKNMPYSVCVFSGGKSLHFGITLTEDLPSEEMYRYYAEWLLKTVPKADQQTKNPSRGIRLPGVQRPGGKMQVLVEAKGRISLNKLRHYLSKYPECKPAIESKKTDYFEFKPNHVKAMANWVLLGMKDGFDFSSGRNNRWFSIAYEFGKCGYDLETAKAALEHLFVPDRDFGKKEWLSAIKSGIKKGRKDYMS